MKLLLVDKSLFKMKMICKIHDRFIPIIRAGRLSNISSFILAAKYRVCNPAISQTFYVLHYIMLYYIILYYLILCYTILYYTILYLIYYDTIL